MPSPFPGMDPYLEEPGLWPDVHHELISVVRESLNAQLRPRYFARIEDRVYVSDEHDPGHRVIEDEIHEARIEVIDRLEKSVVAVIEILSPSNKIPGSRGRESYRSKREQVMRSPSHFIEVDLLRAGDGFAPFEALPLHDYRMHVSRVSRRPRGTLWPIRLDQRLPPMPIPLRDGDADAQVDLQQALTTVYERAGYDLDIDYRREPPPPPIDPAYADWIDRLLRGRGLR